MREVHSEFSGAVELGDISEHVQRIRAERALAAEVHARARRAAFLTRKASRLPLGSNGRREVEAEIAFLEGRGPKPLPKDAR